MQNLIQRIGLESEKDLMSEIMAVINDLKEGISDKLEVETLFMTGNILQPTADPEDILMNVVGVRLSTFVSHCQSSGTVNIALLESVVRGLIYLLTAKKSIAKKYDTSKKESVSPDYEPDETIPDGDDKTIDEPIVKIVSAPAPDVVVHEVRMTTGDVEVDEEPVEEESEEEPELPHKCEFCEQAFSTKSGRTRHQNRCEQNPKNQESEEDEDDDGLPGYRTREEAEAAAGINDMPNDVDSDTDDEEDILDDLYAEEVGGTSTDSVEDEDEPEPVVTSENPKQDTFTVSTNGNGKKKKVKEPEGESDFDASVYDELFDDDDDDGFIDLT